MVYQGEEVGQLLVGRRSPGEPLGDPDRRVLSGLARQAGVVVHAVRLSKELQRFRERLVAAREEERRRLRRDLHDGLGPALAGQALKAGAARDLVGQDPDGCEQLLTLLEGDIQRSLADIRGLIYNLRPPALDDLGFIPAIRDFAVQLSRSGHNGRLQIEVKAPDLKEPMPDAVEVAAFRIVQEAVTNVLRHAPRAADSP